MLKFSANLSLLFSEYPLPERFALAKQCGFQAVELQFPYSLSAVHLKDLLDEQQLNLVLFNVAADDLLAGGEGLAAVPEKQGQFQAALAEAYAYAEILKPQVINILPGRCLQAGRQADYLATFKQNLHLALEAFTPLDITTVFEAINIHDMPGFLIHRQQQMLDVLAAVNHPALKMQYDIYHMQRMQEDISAFISQYAQQIGHIQFADCPGRGQPGTGEIDFKLLFAVINDAEYTGYLGAEYKSQGHSLDSFSWIAYK